MSSFADSQQSGPDSKTSVSHSNSCLLSPRPTGSEYLGTESSFTLPPPSLGAPAPPSVAPDLSRCPPLSDTPWLSHLPSAHIERPWSSPFRCPLRVPGLMVVVRHSWMTTLPTPRFCAPLPHSPRASSSWGCLGLLRRASARRL